MSNILQAKVEVVGIKPFLFHAFGREAIPLQKGERTGVAGNDPEEWKRTPLFFMTHHPKPLKRVVSPPPSGLD